MAERSLNASAAESTRGRLEARDASPPRTPAALGRARPRIWLAALAAALFACGTTDARAPDGGAPDGSCAGSCPGSSADGGAADGGRADGGRLDGGARDGGHDADGGFRRCSVASDCDDGDPRTQDQCYMGYCMWFECATDAACDDGDPLTYDTCESSSIGRLCRHELIPGRCRSAADCADDLACTTETCSSRQICEYAWTQGCGVVTEPRESCPSGAAAGTVCCSDTTPVCLGDCVLAGGSAACPRALRCQTTSTPSVSRFVAVEPAGASCPGGPCPASPPSAGAGCSAASEGLLCDYAPSRSVVTDPLAPDGNPPNGRGPTCACSGGAWTCEGARCPMSPPPDGSLVEVPSWWHGTFSADCHYRGRLCRTKRNAAGELVWRCVTPVPCVLPAPTTGDPCLAGADDACSYQRFDSDEPVTTYAGVCLCQDSGHWDCPPSRSALCPNAKPADNAPCTASEGNSQCLYFEAPGSGSALQTYCACSAAGIGDGRWHCWAP